MTLARGDVLLSLSQIWMSFALSMTKQRWTSLI
jgi:hypothetical protein